LVEDEEDAVAVADLADAGEIAGDGRHDPGGGADHSLRDEGDDRLGPELDDRRLELVGQPQAIVLFALLVPPVAIGIAGGDVVGFDEERREGGAAPRVAANCERRERVAVVALPAGDEMPALRLADLDEILARELERSLDRLRAAGDEICG